MVNKAYQTFLIRDCRLPRITPGKQPMKLHHCNDIRQIFGSGKKLRDLLGEHDKRYQFMQNVHFIGRLMPYLVKLVGVHPKK